MLKDYFTKRNVVYKEKALFVITSILKTFSRQWYFIVAGGISSVDPC